MATRIEIEICHSSSKFKKELITITINGTYAKNCFVNSNDNYHIIKKIVNYTSDADKTGIVSHFTHFCQYFF